MTTQMTHSHDSLSPLLLLGFYTSHTHTHFLCLPLFHCLSLSMYSSQPLWVFWDSCGWVIFHSVSSIISSSQKSPQCWMQLAEHERSLCMCMYEFVSEGREGVRERDPLLIQPLLNPGTAKIASNDPHPTLQTNFPAGKPTALTHAPTPSEFFVFQLMCNPSIHLLQL